MPYQVFKLETKGNYQGEARRIAAFAVFDDAAQFLVTAWERAQDVDMSVRGAVRFTLLNSKGSIMAQRGDI